MIEMRLDGVEELLDAMTELPTLSMKKTIIRNSLKKAVKPLVDQANASLPPSMAGKKGLRVSTRARRGQGYGSDSVFINILYAHPLAHLFEFGTEKRYTQSGAYRGRMPATPFARPAYDSNQRKVVEIFSQEVFIQLDKAGKRLLNKAKAGTLTSRQVKGLR